VSKKPEPPTFRGRSLGITALTAAQLLIGVIHIISGAVLFAFENFSVLPATAAYDIYTLTYGVLTLVFAVYLWQGKKTGWIGTITISVFVIAADTLTLLNLPSVPGIPKAPAIAEITYSTIIIGYLLKKQNRW
jgi:uncharacterized membrane protein HdeD (DUF308 family)